MIVAFRRHTLLPLDDCLYALQPSIPGLTRSSLHRCLQRHGISRLPDLEGDKPAKKKFKATRSASSTWTSPRCGRRRASSTCSWPLIGRRSSPWPGSTTRLPGRPPASSSKQLLEVVPYRIHTLLTDNGIQFAEQPRNRNTILSRQSRFDMICEANGIEHRLTKPNHPWTNGQVERMNRTIKDATTKRYHYDDHDQLEAHLDLFLDAYNHARRLKTLKGLTPAQFIWKEWQSRPELFHEEPCHLMAGLNTWKARCSWPTWLSCVGGSFG